MDFKKYFIISIMMLFGIGIYFNDTNKSIPSLFNKIVNSKTSFNDDLIDIDASNNSKSVLVNHPIDRKLVVYNRVSKCGSSTMIWIMQKLGKEKNFRVVLPPPVANRKFFDEEDRKILAKKISSVRGDTAFIRHFQFFDFSFYGVPPPVYINVIRDPVSRFISRFYYARYGFMANKKNNKNYFTKQLTEKRKNMTLDECVLNDLRNCIEKEYSMPIISFFCNDTEGECKNMNQNRLYHAKQIVVKYYAAVGLTEDLSNTLAVFGAVLPRFFSNAQSLLRHNPETSRTRSKNRKEPSEKIKSILREGLYYDVQFYKFVKERFYRQVERLKELNLIK